MLKITWGSNGALQRNRCKAPKNSGVFIVYIGLKWIKIMQKNIPETAK